MNADEWLTDQWMEAMVRRHFADGHRHIPWGAEYALCPYALMEHPRLALPPFDAGGALVTCRRCKRAYTCSPADDYYDDVTVMVYGF